MIIFIFVVFVFLFLLLNVLFLRFLSEHPILFFKYLFRDLYFYFSRYKSIPKKPFIKCYVGTFGSGKTLSAVHFVVDYYRQYDGKIVWDDRSQNYVTQRVQVLSNVDIKCIPYVKLVSLSQIMDISRNKHIYDSKNLTRTITIVFVDEASTVFNCRQYRDFPVLFLNTLLTSRHALIQGFVLTSQRFHHMDALLRQITLEVIECKKVWRVVRQDIYDGWIYENLGNVLKVPRKAVDGFFCTDQDYSAYDTLTVVDDLDKSCQAGLALSDQEVREALCSGSVVYPASAEYKKNRKKRK